MAASQLMQLILEVQSLFSAVCVVPLIVALWHRFRMLLTQLPNAYCRCSNPGICQSVDKSFVYTSDSFSDFRRRRRSKPAAGVRGWHDETAQSVGPRGLSSS